MAIEIVDFPINSMVIFHSYGAVYQRVAFLRQPPRRALSRPCRRLENRMESFNQDAVSEKAVGGAVFFFLRSWENKYSFSG